MIGCQSYLFRYIQGKNENTHKGKVHGQGLCLRYYLFICWTRKLGKGYKEIKAMKTYIFLQGALAALNSIFLAQPLLIGTKIKHPSMISNKHIFILIMLEGYWPQQKSRHYLFYCLPKMWLQWDSKWHRT